MIVRSRAGDTGAFEELYSSTARWMLGRIRRIVDDGQAEDVLAEVYIQIWKTLAAYDEGRSSPASWMAMIARSRALDHLRHEKSRTGVDAGDSPAPETSTDEGPEQLLSRAQDAKLVRASLGTLDELERRVMGLAYFHECSQSEIALLTGMPLGTVKSLVYRAQQKLRKCFFAPPARESGPAAKTVPAASEDATIPPCSVAAVVAAISLAPAQEARA
ncbi:sigma-70 family RNA polymerase sigma factor [Caenimonas sp. DR4.4]|uniref:Sigma-70 family RNA polymerase sigma factor n=1 Tax=Caenimonas aquaedulcis TaxID=2793270 RepID=A0A931MJA4_9BURK|nr:sigma-70 family RNA polymerase sigma factor [Caenimonas aquaedulcis]